MSLFIPIQDIGQGHGLALGQQLSGVFLSNHISDHFTVSGIVQGDYFVNIIFKLNLWEP